MSSSSSSFSLPVFIFFFISSSIVLEATVPPNQTFQYINEGEVFNNVFLEYGGTYRPLELSTSIYQFLFYNTTPNAFTLGLRMGTRRSESVRRFVWDANPGNPVRDNATLTFGTDGNLVLADADGRIAWQTRTAKKGVVGLELLSNGNLVLVDNKGRFVWQSFDHPRDTLLVGQSLRLNGPNKIVSRKSFVDGSEGPYSLVLENNRLNLYFKSKNSKKPLLYYTSDSMFGVIQGRLTRVRFYTTDSSEYEYPFGYPIKLDFEVSNSSFDVFPNLARPKYNSSSSLLRLGYDGNIKVYTFTEQFRYASWDITFSLFDRYDGYRVRDDPTVDGLVRGLSECKLPFRCGSLGVCEDNQCVACPTPKGLLGWTKNCAPPMQPPCNGGANKSINYYKVVGVEHFMNDYTQGEGPMKVGECREKCNKDCGCLGFFYKEESSKCLLAPELGTLNKVSNTSHVAYIKMSM